VLTAVVTRSGEALEARIVLPHAEEEEGHSEVEIKEGPSPIAPELKELAWGGGSFVVFFLLMRLFLFPRVKKGMEARYALIRSGHEGAEQVRASAQADVATYRSQVAELKAEATARVDAARAQLETERQAKLAEANAAIADRRAAAGAQAAAERQAAADQVGATVANVATRVTEMAIGTRPDAGAVQEAVSAVMGVGAGR
jgi:F-type H+-transporting ATPase subunit b